jgi:hypothetical protein
LKETPKGYRQTWKLGDSMGNAISTSKMQHDDPKQEKEKYYIIAFNYSLKNTILEFLTSIKYLHWGKHIGEICNKAYKTLGLLQRNLSSYPQGVKLQAYKGLIRPFLEYTSAAWDPHQECLQDKLENVQKRSARFHFIKL